MAAHFSPDNTAQFKSDKGAQLHRNLQFITILSYVLFSCASSRELGLINTIEYNNSTIHMEYVNIPFESNNSTLLLEGMLYYDINITSYLGIVKTHDRNGPRPRRNKNEVFGFYNLNIELASRGNAVLHLVRRGYGASDGEDCEYLETPAQSGLAAAEDLAAGVKFLKLFPGVEEDGIIIMGASQGGWAALSSANLGIEGVILTVNLCGGTNYSTMGIGLINNKVQQDWINGCSELGTDAQTPSLWIYSENDRNHPPEYVKSMFNAYNNAGGQAILHILPPFGDNGHYFVRNPELYIDIIINTINEIEQFN
jgi:hypothetical protein